MINESNYNEASDYINGLEHLLIENSPITGMEVAKKKQSLVLTYNGLLTVEQQNKYLNDFAEYISTQMDKYKVGYE